MGERLKDGWGRLGSFFKKVWVWVILVGIFILWLYGIRSKELPSSELVSNDHLDGSVWQVKSWLSTHVSAPSSLVFLRWSGVMPAKMGGYWVECKYRIKNEEDFEVVESKRFHLDQQGTVIEVSDPVNTAALPPAWNGLARPENGLVVNSPWDGSVYQIKRWLRNNLNDPDSVQYIEWGQVNGALDGKGYTVRCKFRAKNALGGYIVSHRLFRLDVAGNILGMTDLP